MGRISIHALREEGDWQALLDRADSDDFYPRPPRGGRPLFQSVGDSFRQFLSTPSARRATSALYSRPPASKFLSTPSARRATQRADTALDARQNFYPRPPRGGRRDRLLYPHQRRAISIHALREEGDQLPPPHPGRTKYFYPRPPRGGRLFFFSISVLPVDFYPRPPRGGRRHGFCIKRGKNLFLSTPSARRATVGNSQSGGHAQLFLSTPSARRATRAATGVKADILFLSTPSARRATYAPCIFRPCRRFLSTPSARRATIVQQQGGWGKLFLSTPSARRATSL